MGGKKPRVTLSDDKLYEMCPDNTEEGVANTCWLNHKVHAWTREHGRPSTGGC